MIAHFYSVRIMSCYLFKKKHSLYRTCDILVLISYTSTLELYNFLKLLLACADAYNMLAGCVRERESILKMFISFYFLKKTFLVEKRRWRSMAIGRVVGAIASLCPARLVDVCHCARHWPWRITHAHWHLHIFHVCCCTCLSVCAALLKPQTAAHTTRNTLLCILYVYI